MIIPCGIIHRTVLSSRGIIHRAVSSSNNNKVLYIGTTRRSRISYPIPRLMLALLYHILRGHIPHNVIRVKYNPVCARTSQNK
jgi:hypothetical protein